MPSPLTTAAAPTGDPVPAIQVAARDRQRASRRSMGSGRPRHLRITELAFDEAQAYVYPTHLREAIDDLPSAPGIYIFHGEEGDLPLYVGKSINIRSRVLSHLRTADEARLLRQTRRISHQRTAGEVGALLLEARLIKTLHPLHNQKLRQSRQLCAWRVVDGRPQVVDAKSVNFAQAPGLYGLYGSRQAALQHLRSLADTHRLCYAQLGLEKLPAGRACFRAQLQQCAGACCGREDPAEHHARFLSALLEVRLVTWPYPGAVALREQHGGLEDFHVIHNWCYLGTAASLAEAKALNTVTPAFDADSYKILCRPMMGGGLPVVML